MTTKEYKLLDGRTIRAKYDRLRMCKITQECLEAFVKEFNTSYRQAKILKKIKENYALMKADERKKGKWESKFVGDMLDVCSECGQKVTSGHFQYNFCPNCGAKMGVEE